MTPHSSVYTGYMFILQSGLPVVSQISSFWPSRDLSRDPISAQIGPSPGHINLFKQNFLPFPHSGMF